MRKLIFSPPKVAPHIAIKGSKSETNRLLILQALGSSIEFSNASSSQDTALLRQALTTQRGTVDIEMAGTAMRFLTAYYAVTPNTNVVLTGAKRMKHRPISPLVDALRQLGADIQYLEQDGFPPLRIRGKKLEKRNAHIQASISSQYISALLMVGAFLKNGLQLIMEGAPTSAPYIDMTLSLLKRVGIIAQRKNNAIEIPPFYELVSNYQNKLEIESDWTSASYYYSLLALSPVVQDIYLTTYFENSLQGDSNVVEIYKRFFGVNTDYLSQNHSLHLSKQPNFTFPHSVEWDFSNTPDLAQTVAATCLGLKIKMRQTGLKTLRIKETDRIEALYEVLQRCGARVSCGEDFLQINDFSNEVQHPLEIETYGDHRMAMAFAPLAATKKRIAIKNPDVVEKSYPEFWSDFKKTGVFTDGKN